METIEEIERIRESLPLKPKDDAVDILIKRKQIGKNVLLYRSAFVKNPLSNQKEKMVKCICTACGGECYQTYFKPENCSGHYIPAPFGFISDNGEEIISGNSCLCPLCASPVEALHIGAFKSSRSIDYCFFTTVENVNGHLVLLNWLLEKIVHSDGSVQHIILKDDGYTFINGKSYRFTGRTRVMGGSYSYYLEWKLLKRYDDSNCPIPKKQILFLDKGLVNATAERHSGLDDYFKGCKNECSLSKYMKIWSRYPTIENLARAGFGEYITGVIKECSYSSGYYYNTYSNLKLSDIKKHINLKKAKPHEMLGIEKSQVDVLRGRSFKAVQFYKEIAAEQNIKLSSELLDKAEAIGINSFINTEAFIKEKNIPIVHLINYLYKQFMGPNENSLISPGFYKDYFDLCVKAYGEMPKSLLWPKNLKRSHDKMLILVEEKENKEISQKIKARAKMFSKFCFTDEETGLMIRPATSHGELVIEGKSLNHCVARYAEAVAKGETLILFIRKIAEPDSSYFTLEFKNNQVQQNRGYQNCRETEDVLAFKEKWLKYLKTIKRKEKNNYGKSDAVCA